jgi:hypothetical protein
MPSTFASVISTETFTEVEAALTWHGLPFINTASSDTFLEGVRHIRDHYEEHGFVPGSREVYKDFRHGQWVMMTRQAFNKGELDPSRIHALEALPYWTWTGGRSQGLSPRRLANILEAARAYAEEYGSLEVSNSNAHAFLHRGLVAVREAREHLAVTAVADFEALPDWTPAPVRTAG